MSKSDSGATIRLSCSEAPTAKIVKDPVELYTKIFKQAGMDLEIIKTPQEEAVHRLKDQEFDGSCGRQKDFLNVTGIDHMVRARTPSLVVKYVILTRSDEPASKVLSDVKIGYQAGQVSLDGLLKSLGIRNSQRFNLEADLFKALKSKKIDAVLIMESSYDLYVDKHQPSWVKLQNVLFSSPVYLHLSNRHQQLLDFFDRRYPYLFAQQQKVKFDNESTMAAQPETASKTEAGPEKLLRFTCPISPDHPIMAGFMAAATRVFSSVGYEFHMEYAPKLRALSLLKQGQVDGHCAMLEASGHDEDTWRIKLNVPVAQSYVQVLSMDHLQPIGSVDDFPEARRVGYVAGDMHVAKLLEKSKSDLVTVASLTQGLVRLESGELDYLVEYSSNVVGQLDNILLNRPVFSVGLLDKVVFYPYLHASHKALLPELGRNAHLINQ
jgi:ABC-type amino acid transport substrate-binding protein